MCVAECLYICAHNDEAIIPPLLPLPNQKKQHIIPLMTTKSIPPLPPPFKPNKDRICPTDLST